MATELLPRDPGKRKTALVTIDADNRDLGKRFLLTEMPAARAERWFRQLVAKMAREGVRLPAGAADAGMAAMPTLPLLTYLSWLDDEALIGELMTCVQAWPDGAPLARQMVSSDTEEVPTIIQLRMEVVALHVGFSLAAVLWSYLPALAVALEMPSLVGSSATPTSPATSPSS
jgi:hypothetical protein